MVQKKSGRAGALFIIPDSMLYRDCTERQALIIMHLMYSVQ